MSQIEARIPRAKEILLEVLRQPETTKNEEIILFTIKYNPNNRNVFPIVKKYFDTSQYSKTISREKNLLSL